MFVVKIKYITSYNLQESHKVYAESLTSDQ